MANYVCMYVIYFIRKVLKNQGYMATTQGIPNTKLSITILDPKDQITNIMPILLWQFDKSPSLKERSGSAPYWERQGVNQQDLLSIKNSL